MSLKSKIEAVIYASEEPVTLQQLVGLLAEETDSELRALDAMQTQLPLDGVTDETSRGADQETVESADQETDQTDVASVAIGSEAKTVDEPSTPSINGVKASGDDSGHAAETIAGDAADVAADANRAATDPGVSARDETPEDSEQAADPRAARERDRQVREYLRRTVDMLMREYAESDRGIEIREVAGGFRMGTKPEYHDAVRGFVKSLKPALKLTLQALETLAVVAYKQPVTAAEISEIRGVDSAGVLGGLIGRKLIATAGRKQVIGRPMLYKTTKEFLVRFGLKDVHELPSMEEFERLAGELNEQDDLPMEQTEAIIERANARGDADHIREANNDGNATGPDTSDSTDADPQAQSDAAPEPGVDGVDSRTETDEHTTSDTSSNTTTNDEPTAP